MLMNKIINDAREHNWISALLDLLIVVIGLFTGLQLDSRWENYQNLENERIYLLELQDDFAQNQDLTKRRLEDGSAVLRDMIVLLEQANLESPSLSSGELDTKFSALQSMPTVIPFSRAYENLTGSGELSILRDRELKTKLADYYSYARVVDLVQSTHEMQLVQHFQPYMQENTEISRVLYGWQEEVDEFKLPEPPEESGIVGLLQSREFRNIVTEKYYSMLDIHSLHQGLLEINDQILALLSAALGGTAE